MDSNCIFCKISNKEVPSKFIFETNSVFVIHDVAPRAKTHLLIIPKNHISNMKEELITHDKTLCQEMFLATSAVAAKLNGKKSFKILCNNEKEAGQEVMHLHWHFVSDEDFST